MFILLSERSCRKPKLGMLLRAHRLYNIDMQKSWMIGNKEENIKTEISAGINNTILVKSGYLLMNKP